MTSETPNKKDQGDQHGSTASVKTFQESIKEAITTGDLEQVQSLLQQWQSDASLPAPNSEHLRYLVTRAARHDRPAILGHLLDQGGEITSGTVLSTANGGSAAVFQVFQDHGWDINSKTSSGNILRYVKCLDNEGSVLRHGKHYLVTYSLNQLSWVGFLLTARTRIFPTDAAFFLSK